ncbi:MAG TPA: cupin domain-containing protein [Planctomycetaceae bacterium]|nr:cupin domain-containing protein [Planctomycetaceae bacterium]
MKVEHYTRTPAEPVTVDGAKNVTVRWLITDKDGAPNFAMRLFEIEPGGHTPRHQHPYEHEVFVLEGEGVLLAGEVEHRLEPGVVAYVPPDALHQFKSTGTTPLKMLCIIPQQRSG